MTAAQRLRENIIIDSVLEHLTSFGVAQKIDDITGTSDRVEFRSRNLDGTLSSPSTEVTRESMDYVSVFVDGAPHHFRRVHAQNTSAASGFRAVAWAETDINGDYLLNAEGHVLELRLCFPGIEMNIAEGRTALAIRDGRLNPQVAEVREFVDATLSALQSQVSEQSGRSVGVDDVAEAINIGSHSAGAANALISHVYLQHRGIPSRALLTEPWGASLARQQLSERLANPRDTLSDDIFGDATPPDAATLRQMMTTNVTSVRSANLTEGSFVESSMFASTGWGVLQPGRNPDNNTMIGDSYHVDMGENHSASDTHKLRTIALRLMQGNESLLHGVTSPAVEEVSPIALQAVVAPPVTAVRYPIPQGGSLIQMMRTALGREGFREDEQSYAAFVQVLETINGRDLVDDNFNLRYPNISVTLPTRAQFDAAKTRETGGR